MPRLQGEPPKRPSKERRIYQQDKIAAKAKLLAAAKRLKQTEESKNENKS